MGGRDKVARKLCASVKVGPWTLFNLPHSFIRSSPTERAFQVYFKVKSCLACFSRIAYFQDFIQAGMLLTYRSML